jgi:hypothetical protein
MDREEEVFFQSKPQFWAYVAEIANEAGYDLEVLRRDAWVAERVHPSRRRPGLSFEHHAEVAALPADQQELFLARAEREGWTLEDMRREVKRRTAS